MQLHHYNTLFKKKTFPITVVCDNINNAPNIGSLFRISDAFGIEKLIFCGNAIPLGRRMTKTSRATEKYVNFEVNNNINDVLNDYKTKGYYVLGIEITSESKAISDYKLQTNQPLLIVLGNENFGVSEEILQLCNDIIHINMYGENSSMNVVQAASICLYELTKQMH